MHREDRQRFSYVARILHSRRTQDQPVPCGRTIDAETTLRAYPRNDTF